MSVPVRPRECPGAQSRWPSALATGRGLQVRVCLHTAQHTKQVAGICPKLHSHYRKQTFFFSSLWPLMRGREKSGAGPPLTLFCHNKQKMPSRSMPFFRLLCLHLPASLWQTKDSGHSSRAYTHSCSSQLSPCSFIWE